MKLYDSFFDLHYVSNLCVMKCYNVFFTKDGIKDNIGTYIIIPIILLKIIFIIIFYKRDLPLIKNKINDIINIKINWKNINKNDQQNNNKKEVIINNKNKIIDLFKNDEKESNENKDNENKKLEIKFDLQSDNILLKNIIKDNQDNINNIENNINDNNNTKAIKLHLDNESIKNVNENSAPPIKNIKKHFFFNLKTNSNKFMRRNNSLDLSNEMFSYKKKKYIINQNKIINTNKQIINKNDYELNILKYEEALKKDKRTFFKYYFSLLKINHPLLFPFHSNDYNSFIIKLYLFLFSFVLYYAINALFFNDSTMHKIYEEDGSFNFIYQISHIIYSSIITGVITSLIKLLSLSNKTILLIKNKTIITNLDMKLIQTIKYLCIKFILFFIFCFGFSILFWYYLSCFSAVYKNTQLHLLKDTIISFGLSLLYPVFI